MTLFKESPKNRLKLKSAATKVAVAEPATLSVSKNEKDEECRAFDYQEPAHVLPHHGLYGEMNQRESSSVGDFPLQSDASEPVARESAGAAIAPPQVNESRGFRTAGTSKPLEVSDEQLAMAGDLLSEDVTTETPNGLYDLETNQRGSSSVGALPLRSDASEPVPRESSVFVASRPQASKSRGFRTAGTSRPLEVSDEQLAQAGDLLSKDVTTEASAQNRRKKAAADSQRTSDVGFHTAGMSKAIAVSAEQLRAAEQLLGEESKKGKGDGCEGDGDEFDDPLLEQAMAELPY